MHKHVSKRVCQSSLYDPMVAELQMINKEYQEWSFNIFPGSFLFLRLVQQCLRNAKANAAFKAAKLAGADYYSWCNFLCYQ